jgi:Lon protease-like protein
LWWWRSWTAAGRAQAGRPARGGTLATVHKVVRMPNQSRFVFTEGVERVRLVRFVQTEPFMMAEVETVEEMSAGKFAGV